MYQLTLFGEAPIENTTIISLNPDTLTLREFFKVYIDSVRFRLRSYQKKERILMRFEKHFENRLVKDLMRADVLAYADCERCRGKMLSTISVEVLVLSSVYGHMRKAYGLQFENPVKDFPYVSSESRVRYLEEEEARRLIDCAVGFDSCVVDFIELALYTGCRKGELLQLRFFNVDWRRRILTIEGQTTKSGRTRYLPLSQGALAVLKRRRHFRDVYCPDSPWVFCKRGGERCRTFRAIFRKVLKLAGIEDFRIHDLRHTFASWLVSEGVELAKIRDLLGHSSIKMTERYAHLAPNRLHEAVGKLDGYLV